MIYSMSVFDLSKYQPEGRIGELCQQGNCDGVILKLGERNMDSGEMELDPKFISHVNEAVQYNLPYGVYIMSRCRDAGEAMQEAQWINDKVAELLNGQEPALGTWWDLERPEVKRTDIWDSVGDAIRTMESWWSSKKIGVYASHYYFYDYLGMQNVINYNIPLWVAQYSGDSCTIKDTEPNVKVVAWQFTTNNNTQDENIWYGF